MAKRPRKVVNPYTGRLILQNGRTYKQLQNHRHSRNRRRPIRLRGSGFGDWLKKGFERVKAVIFGREGAPPAIRDLLERFGDYQISGVQVCRDPVQSYVQAFINGLTLGDYAKRVKALRYDDVYHLFMQLTLTKGNDTRFLKLEKNHVVMADLQSNIRPATACEIAPLYMMPTLNQFIEKGVQLQGPNNFWKYDPITNNCQVFVNTLLVANNMQTPALQLFVLQDAVALLKDNPLVAKVAQGVTTLAGRFDALVFGAAPFRPRLVKLRTYGFKS